MGVDEVGKVSSAAYYCSAKVCDASVFAVCEIPDPTGNMQVPCFLIIFSEDVDPDQGLRCYHGLDLEVKGLVKGVKGVPVLPQFGITGCVKMQCV